LNFAFNSTNHTDAPSNWKRFPKQVDSTDLLKRILTVFVFQFTVQHTVVNDGAYNQAAFVPNASTLMYPPPKDKPSSKWTTQDVLNSLPTADPIPELGSMNFMDVQINASVTGQGPYPETLFGRGVLMPSIDVLQDTYCFTDKKLIQSVVGFYKDIALIESKIKTRQSKDTANFLKLNPKSKHIPETVLFSLLLPVNVMTAIET